MRLKKGKALTGTQIIKEKYHKWSAQVQSKEFRNDFLSHKVKVIANHKGYDVYMYKTQRTYDFAVFEDNNITKYIIYYCQMRKSSQRNYLFKPDFAYCFDAVWKDAFKLSKGFATSLYFSIIMNLVNTKIFVTDKEKTIDGILYASRILSGLQDRDWKIYAGFSASNDLKCLIECKNEDTINIAMSYTQDEGLGYRFRCMLAIKPSVNIYNAVEYDVPILHFKDALTLGVFENAALYSKELEQIDANEYKR